MHPRLLTLVLFLSLLSLATRARATPAPGPSDFRDPLEAATIYEDIDVEDSDVIQAEQTWLPAGWRDMHKRALGKAWTGDTRLARAGTTGVAAMRVNRDT